MIMIFHLILLKASLKYFPSTSSYYISNLDDLRKSKNKVLIPGRVGLMSFVLMNYVGSIQPSYRNVTGTSQLGIKAVLTVYIKYTYKRKRHSRTVVKFQRNIITLYAYFTPSIFDCQKYLFYVLLCIWLLQCIHSFAERNCFQNCCSFGWDRVNFLHRGWYGAMFWIMMKIVMITRRCFRCC